MTTILKIDASAQSEERSLSRGLTKLFVDQFTKLEPEARIVIRDVGGSPPPFVDASFIQAAFTPENEREQWMVDKLVTSDLLIDEVVEADIIVLGAPMYNYGMPAALKAWFDQVARIGRTFSFDLARGDYPIEPILTGKRLVVLSSRGEFGFTPGGPRAHLNLLDPAIAACAHYIGVARDDIETIAIEYQEFKDERHKGSVEAARASTIEAARRLSVS